jgi:hypothetical protein
VATVWRRTSRDEVLESLRIDALSLREAARFIRRHPRYLRMFFALFRSSRAIRRRRLLPEAFERIESGIESFYPERKTP